VDEFHLTKASKADEGGEDGHIEGNRPLRGPEVVIEPPRTREPGEDDVEDGEEEVEWTG